MVGETEWLKQLSGLGNVQTQLINMASTRKQKGRGPELRLG